MGQSDSHEKKLSYVVYKKKEKKRKKTKWLSISSEANDTFEYEIEKEI